MNLLVNCWSCSRLHQGDGVAGLQPRLDEGEATQPGHVQAVGGQRLDHPGVVGHRDELHRHAELLLQIGAERFELAQQFGGRFVGDRRDLEFFQGFGVGERGGQGQGDAGGERQGAFQHGRVLRFNGGKNPGSIVVRGPLGQPSRRCSPAPRG